MLLLRTYASYQRQHLSVALVDEITMGRGGAHIRQRRAIDM